MYETTIIFTEHQPVMEDMCNYWFSIIHGGTPQDHEPLDHKFVDSPSPAPKARRARLWALFYAGCRGWRLEKQTKPSFFDYIGLASHQPGVLTL